MSDALLCAAWVRGCTEAVSSAGCAPPIPMPSDALAALAERNDPERTLVALTMLSTLLTNAKQDAVKYGSIKSSSKALAGQQGLTV